MRKISLILLSMGALLAVSLYWQGSASADGTKLDPPGGFGKKVAGAYLNTFVIPSTGETGTTMTNLNADGTGIVTSGNAFQGMLGDPTLAFQGSYHTVWERTGRREITWRHMLYGYSSDTGEVVLIMRATGTTYLDEDFGGSHGDLLVEVFAPEQLLDPLNPNFDGTPQWGSIEATFESVRLQVP